MALRYVAKKINSEEYLMEKFLKGYFLTSNISEASKFKSEDACKMVIERQNKYPISSFKVLGVNFT